MVRINIILPESKREKFFYLCRHTKKPRRLSMNAALNAMIDGVLSGKVSLSELAADSDGPRRAKQSRS